MSARSEKYSWL